MKEITYNPFTNRLDFAGFTQAELDDIYVNIKGDTMTGTLSFTDTYSPSPAASAFEPAIHAGRNIEVKAGRKIIYDGA